MAIDLELATNPDPRCACLLLLDTSGSMTGAPLDALNAGLRTFQTDLQEDGLARQRVEIAIVTFGGSVTTVQEFISAREFTAPYLSANGGTPMGEAILTGIQIVKNRKQTYKDNGVPYYQPWVFMITDGGPTDEWKHAAEMVRRESVAKSLTFFAVAVNQANIDTLKSITDRVIKLDGINFRELFLWLSSSQKRVSGSKPGDQTALPPTSFGSPV